MRRALLPLGLLLVSATSACNGNGQVCTELYALITTTVLDGAGMPVPGLTIADSVSRTHATFTIPQEPVLNDGVYVVFADGNQGRIREGGDNVVVRGLRDGTPVFTAAYRFDIPDGCHVHKVSGPDTVRVQ